MYVIYVLDPQRPEEVIESLGVGVTGSCELLDKHVGNGAWVPWKSLAYKVIVFYGDFSFTPCFG